MKSEIISKCPTAVQEPCKDCISRQRVIDELKKEDKILYTTTGLNYLIRMIEWLPSITQKSETVTEFADRCRECGAKYGKLLEQIKPKTGHWIDDKCSMCGKGIEDLISSREWYRSEEPNFCPFCGSKLVNLQERGDVGYMR